MIEFFLKPIEYKKDFKWDETNPFEPVIAILDFLNEFQILKFIYF